MFLCMLLLPWHCSDKEQDRATHLDDVRYRSQMGDVFLSEEGDCDAPLARPAGAPDTMYVRNGRLVLERRTDQLRERVRQVGRDYKADE